MKFQRILNRSCDRTTGNNRFFIKRGRACHILQTGQLKLGFWKKVVNHALQFKGRTVIVFVLLAMFASSIVTLTIVDSSFSWGQKEQPAGGSATSVSASSGLSSKDLSKIATTFQLIESKYLKQPDHDQLVNGAINGMLESLEDPFSVYMDQKEAKQFDESIYVLFPRHRGRGFDRGW